MMTAAEVLISLHSIDAAKDGVPLRKVMACLDPCMNQDMRLSFPPESMAVALQQLVTRSVQSCITFEADRRYESMMSKTFNPDRRYTTKGIRSIGEELQEPCVSCWYRPRN